MADADVVELGGACWLIPFSALLFSAAFATLTRVAAAPRSIFAVGLLTCGLFNCCGLLESGNEEVDDLELTLRSDSLGFAD